MNPSLVRFQGTTTQGRASSAAQKRKIGNLIGSIGVYRVYRLEALHRLKALQARGSTTG